MTSIANELFISVAAHLANRVANGQYYYEWAEKTWSWFAKSGLIRSNSLIQDGLDSNCRPRGGFWTYNQGVVLGALLEMNRYKTDANLITQANSIASAAMALLADKNGILHESYDNNTAKYPFLIGHDGRTFKGVFMRNLARLQLHTKSAAQKLFITRNANSIWSKARYSNGSIGVNWAGPLNNNADAPQQAAGLDALVAAYAVSKQDGPVAFKPKPLLASTGAMKSSRSSHTHISADTAVKTTTKATSNAEETGSTSLGPLRNMRLIICPVGDSITMGFGSSDGNGHREHLRNLLIRAGAKTNIVGTARTGNMSDPYHEGWPGAGIASILGNVTKGQVLIKYKPNVVLLHAGTNDMVAGHGPVYNPDQAPEWLETFIHNIYQKAPEAVVLVAQIIEPLNNTARLRRTTRYNAAVAKMVHKLAADGKKILLINNEPWLTTKDPAKYADDIHPNTDGYNVIADGCFAALTQLAKSHKTWLNLLDGKRK